MEPGQQPASREISEAAGRAVARGEITLDGRGELPYPDILYRALGSGDTIPIQLASACESAPIVLTLRHAAKPGDLIVIEEPESHLGERGQRLMAGAMTEMVLAGLRVLVTTCSKLCGRERQRSAGTGRPEQAGFHLVRDGKLGRVPPSM